MGIVTGNNASSGGNIKAARFTDKELRLFRPSLSAASTDTTQVIRDNVVARSWYLYINDELVQGIVNRIVDYVVGSELQPQSVINHKKLGITTDQAKLIQDKLEDNFKFWSNDVSSDVKGACDFTTKVRATLISYLVRGEAFINVAQKPSSDFFPFTTRHQLIEPDRVTNENGLPDSEEMINGIKLDESGERLGYYIQRAHPNEHINFVQSLKWDFFPIRNAQTGRQLIYHCFDLLRDGQERGLPSIMVFIPSSHVLSDYRNSELYAAALASHLVFVTKREGEYEKEIFDGGEDKSLLTNSENISDKGTEFTFEPDTDIQVFNNARPNSNYNPFIDKHIEIYCSAIGIPYELYTLKFNSSYTAARAAFIAAEHKFKIVLSKLKSSSLNPYWNSLADELAIDGFFEKFGLNYDDYYVRKYLQQVVWFSDKMKSLDEVKDASAAQIRKQNKTTSTKEERKLFGVDDDLMSQQIEQEKKDIKESPKNVTSK